MKNVYDQRPVEETGKSAPRREESTRENSLEAAETKETDKDTRLESQRQLIDIQGMEARCLARFRLVSGMEIKRILRKNGIIVLGVRYHSSELADDMLRNNDQHMDVRWCPEDIGMIWVKIGGYWASVCAVDNELSGISAQQWLITKRALRAGIDRHSEEYDKAPRPGGWRFSRKSGHAVATGLANAAP